VNVSLNWLAALLARELDADEVSRRLTLLGAAVEGVERLNAELGDVIVGLVEEVGPHPDADRLTLCRVSDGREMRDVVCGATNVRAGRKYPYAPAGAVLPGGFELSARKIRGVVSNGMLCSPRELGLGMDHEGIMDLETEAEPGTRLVDAMPLEDVRLEIDVTADRPDLLCHKGVARELAAAYAVPLKLPAIPAAPAAGSMPRRVAATGTVDGVDITIEDAEGCPRYMAAVIRGVTIGPSPDWLQARLRSIGARPINNVVDATNYILHELNQPMHAFDLARVGGPAIVVRRAHPGERLVTLDGEARELDERMTMICDADGVVAIAGVMGGEESEVRADTRDVLLECAYFDPRRIRATRQALKMSTDASYRFERGIDREGMGEALVRAVQLIRAVAGGVEPEAPIDVYPKPTKTRSIFLRPQRVEQVLGVPVERGEIERLLVQIGFPVAPKDERLHVQVPGWRPDVAREVDLIEEVARLTGYDAFPVEMRPFRPSAVPPDPREALKHRVRHELAGLGLNEARSLSLTAKLGDDAVPVMNPLSAEDAYLRRDLLSGLIRSVERNWAVRQRDIRLFEVGVVFDDGGADVPNETLRAAAVFTGARVPPHWSDGGETPAYDVWDLKGSFETAVRIVGGSGTIQAVEGGWEWRDNEGRVRGRATTLDADRPAWAAPLFGFELDLEVTEPASARFSALPATPPVERDVALVLPASVSARQVEDVIRESAGPLLVGLTVFDEYRGKGVTGRSVAWRLVFRAADRTLKDEEADRALSRVLSALKEALGVERREAAVPGA
jgi:phenylalanyl-tRNA synthetase beta chain